MIGFTYDEIFNNHSLGPIVSSNLVSPVNHWETPDGKRRVYSILQMTDLRLHIKQLPKIVPATYEDISLVHSTLYIDKVIRKSKDENGGVLGPDVKILQHGYEVCAYAVGGAIQATIESITNKYPTYALIRPSGHHALKDNGMGFCVFNNIAIATKYARNKFIDIKKVAIIDFDCHHGNGTQEAFYNDENVLFISIHQDRNYPNDSGLISENNSHIINVPLPPGSGSGAYRKTFDDIVIPCLKSFRPDLLMVSAGYDANFIDPLGRMMLSSQDYNYFAKELNEFSKIYCNNRFVTIHEGGYSEAYVPYCASRYIEGITNTNYIKDPFLNEINKWGYQEIQTHQQNVISAIVANICSLKINKL